MGEIILSGQLGQPRIISTSCYTDWVYRPRRPEELRPELGGGVTFRQGAHQFDILCALAGARATSVRAVTYDWDAARSTIGAHAVMVNFANGAVGTAIYNGYGHFQSVELTQGIGEWGQPVDPGSMSVSRRPDSAQDELARKLARARTAIRSNAPYQPHFGLTLVSCEKGDMRQSPGGVLLYTEQGRREIVLPTGRSPRELVLDEFARAIAGDTVLHTGEHGAAVTEICAAALRSARENKEIELSHQMPRH
jgi:phthalate 4,5-cis-dihydrodiol dehydrogenase